MNLENKKLTIFITIVCVALISMLAITILVSNKKLDSSTNQNFPVSSPTSYVNQAQEVPVAEPVVADNIVRILTLGDTGLLEPLGSRVVNDPKYDPLSEVKDFFKTFDYVVGTLETTIDGTSVGSPNPGKAYTFSTPIQSINIFKNAGFNAFSYAGNHARDYGSEGLNHTIEVLKSVGIGTFGAGANNDAAYTPLYVTLKDTKIAFLGFNCMEYDFNHATDNDAGTASFSEWRVRDSISKAQEQADVVIVFAHWGEEHTLELDPVWQVQWAGIFTAAGADIVIGGHPHIVQKQDTVNGKPVFYSIGNFMYPGQAGYAGGSEGIGVEIDIENKQIKELKVHQTQMTNEGVPSIKS